jgi:hypothetical protein
MKRNKKNTYSVNPEESTNTATLRTRRHSSRYLKLRKPRPHTSLINTKDSEILRLNILHIVFVRNSQRTSFQVVEPVSMVLFGGRLWTDVVGVVGFSDIATLGRSEERCGAFVACDFGCGWFSSWEFEDVSCIGRVSEVIVKPPFFENHVLDRSNGTIVVGKGLLGNIETEHTRMEHSYKMAKKKQKKKVRTSESKSNYRI